MSAVVLVVDDDPSVRASTARLLRAHGYTAIQAASAALAVQRATEIHPDVILMDLHMPGGSGIDAAREIKQQAELRDTPIIAMSATPPEWTDLSTLFRTVLPKPCPSSRLLSALSGAMRL